MSHVVVIGAGQAGSSLVGKLRAEGFEGRITLVGAETAPPYQRPPLSKAYLLGQMDKERLFLRPQAWYGEHGIDLRLGATATGLDLAAREVTLSDGETLGYDRLALCTGAHPRRLPAEVGGDLAGVYTMRDLADADALAPELVEGRRLLVVGGGYIGLEAAAVAAKRGLKVTVIEQAARILARVAAPETATYFRDLHASHGVEIREGCGLDRLLGEDRATGARLSDGTEIACDFAIVGVGVAPGTALAEPAGLAIENGIRCDIHCRASDENVWAAGDCASLLWGDMRIRLESVGNAIDMAETAALNIIGRGVEYRPRPWFWSDQYDVKLQIAGLNAGWDAVHVRPGETPAQTSHWYYRGDKLIAVDAMNDSRAYMVGKRLIEGGKSPDPAHATDPSTELKSLLK
jgi:3-phenylpropionate/trans-cinnamate dioxygenase ferredoxin reductase subunit